MPRGTGMPPTRRRNRRPKHESPEALAGRLPKELRSLEGVYTPGDYQSLRRDIASWVEQTAPGDVPELAARVMATAGITAADFYRRALTRPVLPGLISSDNASAWENVVSADSTQAACKYDFANQCGAAHTRCDNMYLWPRESSCSIAVPL